MAFWKLTLSYDGTGFHGWQVQPRHSSVQGTLSDALHRMTGERVLPQGSGRTDAGVHALAQVASFALEAQIPAENLLRALNRMLPGSIRVLAAEEVGADFHARHSAVRKSYEYRLFEQRRRDDGDDGDGSTERICSPFLAPYVGDCRWPLDLDRMQQAAILLIGTHDFTSFAAADPDLAQRSGSQRTGSQRTGSWGTGPNPVKTIFVSAVDRSSEALVYRVTGSGFLHHMVRNIVGTLVEVGRGALMPEDISRILGARDRSAVGPTAPAKGLFLTHVDYDATRVHYGERYSSAKETSA
jgi:tRNA pseudouridine38-40 synthase